MIKMIDSTVLTKCNGNPPASVEDIRLFETTTGIHLREDYAAFLLQLNGGEGFIGESYAILWPLEELFNRNAGYKVSECAPGLFLFGSDGGGEAFAFDRRSDPQTIVMVPFIPLTVSDVIVLAEDFSGFIQVLMKGLFD